MEAVIDLECVKVAIPKLRFGGFDLPWKEKQIKDIATKVNSGKTPLGGEAAYVSAGIIFIRSQNVIDNILSLENVVFISEAVNNTMKNSVVLPGDILLNITGASLGRSCVVPYDFSFGNVNQHVCIVRLTEDYDPCFLQPLLASKNGQEKLENVQTGSGREGLNFQAIKSLKFYFPSLPEQQKIASFLSAVDEKIQLLKRKKELLEQYKKGIMQQLFSGKLRFKDENGEDYPDWEEKHGNYLFESISDKKHNSDLPILAITQDYGAIPRDLIEYKVSVTEQSVSTYKVVQVGDFIISLRSFQGGIEYSDYKGICSPAYVILRPKINIDRKFYKYYFKTDAYIKLLNKNLEGIRDGKMISYKYFSEIVLPLPSVEEQRRITSFLILLDEKIKLVSNQVDKTQTFKKGLLQQMFV